jgi:hypothetical protein
MAAPRSASASPIRRTRIAEFVVKSKESIQTLRRARLIDR